MKRLSYLAVLCLAVALALGCSSKKPIVFQDEPPPPDEDRMVTQRVERDVPHTPPFGEDATSSSALPAGASDPYNLKPVYFDFDRYDLTPKTTETLNTYAGILRKHGDVKLRLEGHCDERGTREYNQALGDRRANSVFRYLVDLGVSPRRLSTISFGEEYPADPGHTEFAWAQNRRVEFKVQD